MEHSTALAIPSKLCTPDYPFLENDMKKMYYENMFSWTNHIFPKKLKCGNCRILENYIKGGDMVNRNAGFTLIELFIVMALIGIMTAIAVPGFMKWVSNYRLKTASHDIRSLLQTAKVRAVKENSNIVILFDIDNDSYEAFVDNRQGEPWSREEGEKIVKQGKMPDGIDLYEASFSNEGAKTLFNSRGFPRYGGELLIGHVYMRNDQNKIAKVILSSAGNIKIE